LVDSNDHVKRQREKPLLSEQVSKLAKITFKLVLEAAEVIAD
jgi:hypothetical protein